MKKSEIIHALKRLGEIAHAEGLTLDITIYGGVAMSLLFDSRAVTKDVDAIIRPESEAKRLAAIVARELGLHENWINADVRMFLSDEIAARESVGRIKQPALASLPGLRLSTPNPRYLLAMKSRALRPKLPGVEGDWDDLAVLIRDQHIRSCDEIDAIIEEYFPDHALADKGPKIRNQVQELIETINRESPNHE